MMSLTLFLVIIICVFSLRNDEKVATVYYVDQKLKVVLGEYKCQDGVACAKFRDDGWDKLWVLTNSKDGEYSNDLQSKAAGMIEGALCWKQIYSIFTNHNHMWGWFNKTIPVKVLDFMKTNLDWTRKQSETQKDPFWVQVKYLISQFDGMLEGYLSQAEEKKKLTELNLFFLQSAGDLYGVLNKFNVEVEDYGFDCSALVKLVQNANGTFSDVFAGHDTWRSFGIQNKVFKFFTLDFNDISAKTVAFSSSPGFISSKDDYYQTSAGLVVLETTNAVFKKELADEITPYSVFTWIRSPLASRVAKSGAEWGNFFSQYSSATYTNQWIIIDMNKFHPNEKIDKEFLYILEEIPLYIHNEDMTDHIKKTTYWPSYNIPYFPDVYNKSGYEEKKEKEGDEYDYYLCTRSKLFGNLESKIVNFEDYAYVMQYNEYKTDPLQKNNPCKAIMSRCDLAETNPRPSGGIDGKIVKYNYKDSLSQKIIAGPTKQDKDQTPPFEWTDKWKTIVHEGQPHTYDFNWIDIKLAD